MPLHKAQMRRVLFWAQLSEIRIERVMFGCLACVGDVEDGVALVSRHTAILSENGKAVFVKRADQNLALRHRLQTKAFAFVA